MKAATLAVTALLLGAAPAHAVTPLISDLIVKSRAYTDIPAQYVTDTDSALPARGEPLDYLYAGASNKVGETPTRAGGRALSQANFTSPSAGRVEVIDLTGSVLSDGPAVGIVTNVTWTYSFRTEADGQFNYDFFAQGFGDIAGAGRYQIAIRDVAVSDPITLYSGAYGAVTDRLTAQGQSALLAGHEYIVGLFLESHFEIPGAGSRDGSEYGWMNWSITEADAGAVPEPSTWALLICGFGAAGAALRRQRLQRA